MTRIALLIAMTLSLSACEQVALMTTAPKKPAISKGQLTKTATHQFWQSLHQGHYQRLPQSIHLLTAAYLKNPNDPNLAAYLGFAHIWKITERQREQGIPPTITDHMILAKFYFNQAVALNPSDARLQGFLGVSELATGKIFADEREQVRGYFQLKYAIHQWPAFNYFTAGYPMTMLDAQSPYFKQALAWQWDTLDVCAGTTVNRNNPDFAPYMKLETQTGKARACWNSWIAPHNFEGFFMNMGDMLVKQGNWPTAIKIYKNARLSKNYQSWPYRHMLEKRIQHARENVKYFQENNQHAADKVIMFNSGYGCVVCHQQ